MGIWNNLKQSVNQYFQPTGQVRGRDFLRELVSSPQQVWSNMKNGSELADGPEGIRGAIDWVNTVKGRNNVPSYPQNSVVPVSPIPQPIQAVPTPQIQQPVAPTSYVEPHFQTFMQNIEPTYTNPRTVQELPSDLRDAIAGVSGKSGIPSALLAAISQQETGLRNIPQHFGGLGRGYFQIDLGQHPDVTEQQAMDPNFAAEFAANLLLNRMKTYSGTSTPVTNAIRAYNGGIKNPKTKTYYDKVLKNLQTYEFK